MSLKRNNNLVPRASLYVFLYLAAQVCKRVHLFIYINKNWLILIKFNTTTLMISRVWDFVRAHNTPGGGGSPRTPFSAKRIGRWANKFSTPQFRISPKVIFSVLCKKTPAPLHGCFGKIFWVITYLNNQDSSQEVFGNNKHWSLMPGICSHWTSRIY